LSYDRYNTKADRIFRVAQHGQWNGGKFDLAVTSAPYAPTLKSEFPQIVDACRIDPEGGSKITYGDKTINEGSILFTDNSIFDIFSYQFLYGDAKDALAKPQTIVLTKTLGRKHLRRCRRSPQQNRNSWRPTRNRYRRNCRCACKLSFYLQGITALYLPIIPRDMEAIGEIQICTLTCC
jgi:hypothetical protein